MRFNPNLYETLGATRLARTRPTYRHRFVAFADFVAIQKILLPLAMSIARILGVAEHAFQLGAVAGTNGVREMIQIAAITL